MENYSQDQRLTKAVSDIQQAFLARVYGWMGLGLLLTAITSVYIFSSGLLPVIFQNRILFYGIIIGQFGLVILLSARIGKISATTAILLFVLYSILTGVTFSAILAIFLPESVFSIFLTTAGMFGAMSLYGYMTKKSLVGVGQFMIMGLIGVVIASVVNIFLGSADLQWIISFISVIVFTGLTAWDTQKLKNYAVTAITDNGISTQASIFGALILYLDFVNLFIALLNLFGKRR
jgi:FtsH-binding integral membrane protein